MAGVKGNKGGGRKSAYQELADATAAHKIFFGQHNQEEIEVRIKSGKFSLADRFLLNGMEGDSAIVIKAYNKAVPDKVDPETKPQQIIVITGETAARYAIKTHPSTGPSSS